MKQIIGSLAVILFAAFCGFEYGQAKAKEAQICKIWVSHTPYSVKVVRMVGNEPIILMNHKLLPFDFNYYEWINLCEEEVK